MPPKSEENPQKSPKFSDFESFNENPFQKSLRNNLKFGWRKSDPDKAKPMVDNDTGETVFLSPLGNVNIILKDNAEFTKLFGSSYEEICKLSTPGLKMLLYIFSIIKKDIDWIKIEPALAMEWCGYNSRTNVHVGICALLDGKFICRKTGGQMEYYINVNRFFNGKRTNLRAGTELKERLISDAKKGKIQLNEQNQTEE